MADLSFSKIKEMTQRQREKLKAEELLNLILNYEPPSAVLLNKLNDNITALSQTIRDLGRETRLNSDKIIELNVANVQMTKNIEYLNNELSDYKDKLNQAEQYLRVNNVEIAGLPSGDDDERTALDFFNNVLEVAIKKEDIDICHKIPSKRKDNKNVLICKFLSRKSKMIVLGAKEKLRDHNKVNKDNTILLYEHLSPSYRALYIEAAKFRYDRDFKFLWTRNGIPFLRKDENSRTFKITSAEVLETIPT